MRLVRSVRRQRKVRKGCAVRVPPTSSPPALCAVRRVALCEGVCRVRGDGPPSSCVRHYCAALCRCLVSELDIDAAVTALSDLDTARFDSTGVTAKLATVGRLACPVLAQRSPAYTIAT